MAVLKKQPVANTAHNRVIQYKNFTLGCIIDLLEKVLELTPPTASIVEDQIAF
jgi:hypothetical protein